MISWFSFLIFLNFFHGLTWAASAPYLHLPPSPKKPVFEEVVAKKSLKTVLENLETLCDAGWDGEDFQFINAILIRTPFKLAQPLIFEFSNYPKISSAIKKLEYNEQNKIIELIGEAAGLHMHSWISVDLRYRDEAHYEVIRGDMVGFKVQAFLWDKEGKTLALAKGRLSQGRIRFPRLVQVAFPTIAEIVLSVATKNFRKFVEDDYNKKRTIQ